MLNYIWLGLILAAVVIGGVNGRMPEAVSGAFDMAETAVKIALGLIGIMALWLGIMRLAEKSGLVKVIAGVIRPVMTRLFPDVPADHPAMGSMIMNMAANMLGLANAATPLGLRAMRDLERLNPHPGVATNAMCTFLAINTSSVQLIPATAVAILASAGSHDPYAIIGTAFLATLCSTTVGITSVKLFEKMPLFRIKNADIAAAAGAQNDAGTAPGEEPVDLETAPEPRPVPRWGRLLLGGTTALFLVLLAAGIATAFFDIAYGNPGTGTFAAKSGTILRTFVQEISVLAVPFLLTVFPLYAALRGLAVYEEFVEGAKEAFGVAVRIIPFLVTILVAIGMFRGAGGIELLTQALAPVLNWVRFPPDLVPMAIMRPLSGSGSLGLFTELVERLGPDDIVTRMGATFFGSSETTFYVVAVYFGSVGVSRTRHAVPAGLLADLAGLIAAVFICRLVFA